MRRTVLIPFMVILGLAALARSGAAQTPANSTRFGVSGSVGMFAPRDSTMSAVYGSRLTAITAQVDVSIWSHFSVFGGLRWLPASGQTVEDVAPAASQSFSTSVGVRTFRVGLLAHARVAPRLTLGGGGGVGMSNYSESIPDLELETRGWATGGFAMAEARYAVRPRWSVIGRFEYASIPTKPASGESVNIGGPDVQVGLRFAF